MTLKKNLAVRLDPSSDGPTNMASDEALITRLSHESVVARVYGWTEPWVTIGKFQSPDRDLLPNCAVPWTARPTGGRAVLHGHDITVGLAMRLDAMLSGGENSDVISRSVRRAYRAAVGPIVAALCACGIDAVLGESIKGLASGPNSADCFAHLSANDVIDRGTLRKVCGVAMSLRSDHVLVQASIPVGPPLIDPATVFANPSAPNWTGIGADRFAFSLETSIVALGLE